MSSVINTEKTFTPIKNASASKEGSWADYYINRFCLKISRDTTLREKKLIILHKFLDGTIYDNLRPFYQEYSGGGDDCGRSYVPLAQRRPSVQYNLCKIIVDQASAMLFGEGHFPNILWKENEEGQLFLQNVTRQIKLNRTMLKSSKIGQVGSVCLRLKVLNGKFYVDALKTQEMQPYFDPLNPDELIKVVQKRKFDGSTLLSSGYSVKEEDLNQHFFLIREWDKEREVFYNPYPCEKDGTEFKPSEDKDKSSDHDFGFVPIVWIQNLTSDDNIDGESTFGKIVDMQIEIYYQLSQNGRLLKYNSDPTFVVKNPTSLEGERIIKSVNILNLDEKGDAYYAEMSGKSTESVMSYVKQLREYALEVCRGNRTSPDKLNSAQSGKALEMLNLSLIELVGEMRLTYGDGLLKIYSMILKVMQDGKYSINYSKYKLNLSKDEEHDLTLDWPSWYPETSREKYEEAQALTTYTSSGLLSRETAISSIAKPYNILDVEEEKKKIEEDEKNSVETNMKAEYDGFEGKSVRGARDKKSSGA